VEKGNQVSVKLCGRQIFELPSGQWHGLVRLSRGLPGFAHVLYEGPASIDVQYAVIARTLAARPRLGDPIRIAALRVLDHDWPTYELQRHLQSDGSLIVGTCILELFDQEGDDHAKRVPRLKQ
jgi:hypothetical protein